jgi:adenylate kinase
MKVLMLGPQGSGKGTQASRISATYGNAHIATGDMLRGAIAADSELGRRIKPIYDNGELVPDDLMIELIRGRLEQEDTAEGFVLDGFPRTMAQAKALDAMLVELGRELSVVFELQVSDGVCVQRLLRRGQIEGRADDSEEAILRRLRLYHEETEPLVEYYRAQGNLVGIHADRTVDEVFEEIQQTLDEVLVRK